MKAKRGEWEFEGTEEEITNLIDRIEKPALVLKTNDIPMKMFSRPRLPKRMDWNRATGIDVEKYILSTVGPKHDSDTLERIVHHLASLASKTYGDDGKTADELKRRASYIYSFYIYEKNKVFGRHKQRASHRLSGRPSNHSKGLKVLKNGVYINYKKFGINMLDAVNAIIDMNLSGDEYSKAVNSLAQNVVSRLKHVYGDSPHVMKMVKNRIYTYISLIRRNRRRATPQLTSTMSLSDSSDKDSRGRSADHDTSSEPAPPPETQQNIQKTEQVTEEMK